MCGYKTEGYFLRGLKTCSGQSEQGGIRPVLIIERCGRFAAAAQNLNENEVEKKAFGGDKNQGCFFPYWRDLLVRQRHTADRNRLRYVLWYFCGAVGCAGIPPLHKTSSRSLLAASARGDPPGFSWDSDVSQSGNLPSGKNLPTVTCM